MAERCPACDAIVDDTGVAAGGPLRCDRCGTRFPKPRARAAAPVVGGGTPAHGTPRARDDVDELGIHPALAKKYRDRNSLPPQAPLTGQHEQAHPSPLAPPVGVDSSFPGSSAGGTGPITDVDPSAPPVEPNFGGRPITKVLDDSDIVEEGHEPGTTNPGRPAAAAKRSLEGPAAAAAPPAHASPAGAAAPPPAAPPAAVPPRAGAVVGGAAAAPAPAVAQQAAPAATARARPGQAPPGEALPVIPGYEVAELVGKGAMGRVYRATLRRGGAHAPATMTAVKILAPELAARQDFIARFEREGAAMRAVNHPGVVAVIDAGSARQPDGSVAHYIAMEFVEGPPLRRHLDKGPLSPERALRFARLIIQGLGAAHARGVIHRDLKPENILAPPGDDRLVLVDFGLAGILDEENDPHPNLTKSRMTMGTVNYMAPEQRTDAKRVDQRADLYAAGVIFYELLTGDLPLGRFALPTERNVPVPASVDRCIVRALARNPDERYQQAAQFDADLRAIEDELARNAGRETVLGRARGGTPGATSQRSIVGDLVGRTGALLSNAAGAAAGVGSGGAGPRTLVPASDGPATAWVTAVPWIKRSTLWWSVAALVAGVALAVMLSGVRACAG